MSVWRNVIYIIRILIEEQLYLHYENVCNDVCNTCQPQAHIHSNKLWINKFEMFNALFKCFMQR